MPTREQRANELKSLNAVARDHWPTCPRCSDLVEPGRYLCPSCGAGLMVGIERIDLWNAARKREVASATGRAEAS